MDSSPDSDMLGTRRRRRRSPPALPADEPATQAASPGQSTYGGASSSTSHPYPETPPNEEEDSFLSGGLNFFRAIKNNITGNGTSVARRPRRAEIEAQQREAARLMEERDDQHARDTVAMIKHEVMGRLMREDEAKKKEIEARRRMEELEAALLEREKKLIGEDSKSVEQRHQDLQERKRELDQEEVDLQKRMRELDRIKASADGQTIIKRDLRKKNREKREAECLPSMEFKDCESGPEETLTVPKDHPDRFVSAKEDIMEDIDLNEDIFGTPDSSARSERETTMLRDSLDTPKEEAEQGGLSSLQIPPNNSDVEKKEKESGSTSRVLQPDELGKMDREQKLSSLAEFKDQYEKERALLETEQANLLKRRLQLNTLQQQTMSMIEEIGGVTLMGLGLESPLCTSMNGDTSSEDGSTHPEGGDDDEGGDIYDDNIDWTFNTGDVFAQEKNMTIEMNIEELDESSHSHRKKDSKKISIAHEVEVVRRDNSDSILSIIEENHFENDMTPQTKLPINFRTEMTIGAETVIDQRDDGQTTFTVITPKHYDNDMSPISNFGPRISNKNLGTLPFVNTSQSITIPQAADNYKNSYQSENVVFLPPAEVNDDLYLDAGLRELGQHGEYEATPPAGEERGSATQFLPPTLEFDITDSNQQEYVKNVGKLALESDRKEFRISKKSSKTNKIDISPQSSEQETPSGKDDESQ